MISTESSYISLPQKTYTASSTITIPYQSSTFIGINEPTLNYYYHPKSIVFNRIHCWCTFHVCVLSAQLWPTHLNKCVMTSIYHYINSITQSIFTALKITCASLANPSPKPLATPEFFFNVSIVLPFPECHIVGIIVCSLFKLTSFT